MELIGSKQRQVEQGFSSFFATIFAIFDSIKSPMISNVTTTASNGTMNATASNMVALNNLPQPVVTKVA